MVDWKKGNVMVIWNRDVEKRRVISTAKYSDLKSADDDDYVQTYAQHNKQPAGIIHTMIEK